MESDEAGGVILVIRLGRSGFHLRYSRIVETDRGYAAGAHDVAFVELHAHGARDVLSDMNLVFGGPACTWRYAGEGELVFGSHQAWRKIDRGVPGCQ